MRAKRALRVIGVFATAASGSNGLACEMPEQRSAGGRCPFCLVPWCSAKATLQAPRTGQDGFRRRDWRVGALQLSTKHPPPPPACTGCLSARPGLTRLCCPLPPHLTSLVLLESSSGHLRHRWLSTKKHCSCRDRRQIRLSRAGGLAPTASTKPSCPRRPRRPAPTVINTKTTKTTAIPCSARLSYRPDFARLSFALSSLQPSERAFGCI